MIRINDQLFIRTTILSATSTWAEQFHGGHHTHSHTNIHNQTHTHTNTRSQGVCFIQLPNVYFTNSGSLSPYDTTRQKLRATDIRYARMLSKRSREAAVLIARGTECCPIKQAIHCTAWCTPTDHIVHNVARKKTSKRSVCQVTPSKHTAFNY